MKTNAEIQKAHDRLYALLNGEIKHEMSDRAVAVIRGQLDVLCWLLEHETVSFSELLECIDKEALKQGLWLSQREECDEN